MDIEAFNQACNGKTESNGGLNLPQFKRDAIHLYPDHKNAINSMSRKELEAFCKQHRSLSSPKRTPSPKRTSSPQRTMSPHRPMSPIRVFNQMRLPTVDSEDLIGQIRRAILSKNHRLLVDLLYDCDQTNCDLNTLNDGKGVIHIAIDSHNLPIMNLVLKYGADPNIEDPITGYMPLDSALHDNDLKLISLLVKNGARIPADIIYQIIQGIDHLDVEVLLEYFLKQGAPVGSARTLVEEILSHENEADYEFNDYLFEPEDYDRLRHILELFEQYDPEVKEPGVY